jgi:hypothetical protein
LQERNFKGYAHTLLVPTPCNYCDSHILPSTLRGAFLFKSFQRNGLDASIGRGFTLQEGQHGKKAAVVLREWEPRPNQGSFETELVLGLAG